MHADHTYEIKYNLNGNTITIRSYEEKRANYEAGWISKLYDVEAKVLPVGVISASSTQASKSRKSKKECAS